MADTRQPLDVVKALYEALGREDFAGARRLLGEPFSFVAWFDRLDDPDAYIEVVRKLRGFIVKADFHHVLVDGDHVCVIYDATTVRGDVSIAAAWFHVCDGRIVSVRIICDPRPMLQLFEKS